MTRAFCIKFGICSCLLIIYHCLSQKRFENIQVNVPKALMLFSYSKFDQKVNDFIKC